jgi:hypothetical protein
VTTTYGTSATSPTSKFSYGLPTVTSLSPAAGPVGGGNTVTINGTNFISGATTVAFGAQAGTGVAFVNSSRITATAPAGTDGSTVDVTVTTPAGTSAVSTLGTKYSYGAPTVTALSPASGPTAGQNIVIITGTGFTGVTAVKFGTTAAVRTVNSPTQITATAPPGALGATVDVTVTNPAGTSVASSADQYTYYSYDLMVVNGTTTKTYTVATLKLMATVSGFGMFLNTFPRFVDQGELTGVSVLSLIADTGGLPVGASVRVTASDGYTMTFTYDQVANNHFTMYNPNFPPPTPVGSWTPTVITSIADPPLQFIVAYEQFGEPITDGGPLRTAFVSPVAGEQATDSVNWIKYVTEIEVIP